MYSFDTEKYILFAGKVDNRFHFDGYPVSDHYRAYQSYLYGESDDYHNKPTLKGDLNNYADMISNALSKERGMDVDVKFKITKIIEMDSTAPEYSRGTYQTTVYGVYLIDGMSSREFPIVRIPYVDRFGTITKKWQTYAISATFEPSRFITLDKEHILNIMLQAVKLQVVGDTDIEKMTTEVAKQNVRMITLCYYVGNFMRDRLEFPELFTKYKWIDNVYTTDVPNVSELLKQLVLPSAVTWYYRNVNNFDVYDVYTDKEAVKNTLDKYANEVLAMFGLVQHGVTKISKFDATSIRESLNELLSIDRGYDKKLSRPVYTRDGELLYDVGETVTNEVLGDLNANHINCYYVQLNTSRVEGVQLAFNVGIERIPSGTLIPKQLCDINEKLNIPYNRYYVTTEDLYFDEGEMFVIPENTVVDSSIIDFIMKVELCKYMVNFTFDAERVITSVDHSKPLNMTNKAIAIKVNAEKGHTATNIKYIILEEEILGNQHFLIDWEWKYVSSTTDEIAEPASTLTVYDLLGLMSLLPRVVSGNYLNKVADRDYGMRKRVCLIDDHLHKAWDKCFKGFAYNPVSRFRQMLRKIDSPDANLTFAEESFCSTISNWWIDRTLFSTRDMKVINIADKICPPAYVSSLNRVNTIIKNKRGASDKMRFLAMGFYGRICPYETPASGKLGLVNTKAVHAIIENGYIYTEYYKVKDGRILFDKKIRMTVSEEEQYIIADIMSLDFDETGKILNDNLVLARVPVVNAVEKHIVENVPVHNIQYVNCYPDSTLSPTATTIPFIGSDDPVRVSYELSMCKQTRGLLYREVPLVMTNASFDMVRYNTMFQIVAEDDGEIIDIQQRQTTSSKRAGNTKIFIRYDNMRNQFYHGSNEMAFYEHCYEFPMVEYSYSSVIVRYLEVKAGDRVKKGDVLVSSNYTKDGFMATGVDALVAIIPAGYNYEDGIQISEAFEKKLTSFGHSNTEVMLANNQMYLSEPFSRYIDSNATTVLHLHDTKRDKIVPFKTEDLKGWVVSVSNAEVKRRKSDFLKKRLDAISVNSVNEGDKTATQHGNKGVTPKVAKNIDMFYLSNGEIIDIAYNPLGFGARMILGNIKAIHMGLACKVLGLHLCVQPFNELPWEEQRLLLLYAWECANNGVDKANADPRFSMYPQSMKDYVKTQEAQIVNWKGVFDQDGCAYVINPATGKPTRTKVVIGYNYVYKLVQEIEEKEHARGSILSDVPYVVKYAQPTRGAGNNGGQSYGYMEQAGLLAHGATNFMHELQHERGDNIYMRQKQFFSILGSDENIDPDALDQLEEFNERRSVEYFKAVMTALGCSFEVDNSTGEEDGLVDTTNYNAGDKFFYSDRAVLGARTSISKERSEAEKEESNKMVDAAIQYSDDDDDETPVVVDQTSGPANDVYEKYYTFAINTLNSDGIEGITPEIDKIIRDTFEDYKVRRPDWFTSYKTTYAMRMANLISRAARKG